MVPYSTSILQCLQLVLIPKLLYAWQCAVADYYNVTQLKITDQNRFLMPNLFYT